MEEKVIKTIREAFKIAYINKLLKESAEDLANKLTPAEREAADAIYEKWVNGTGYRNLKWDSAGELSFPAQAYIVEKAMEKYAATGDKKAHDAISLFYYPYPNSLTFNTIMRKYGNTILSALGGADKKDYLEDVLRTAWSFSIGDANQFDKYVQNIKGGLNEEDNDVEKSNFRPYEENNNAGIGPYLLRQLSLAAQDYSMSLGAKRRGGGARVDYIDQYGSDSEGERKYDLPGGMDVDVETAAQGAESQLSVLYDTFKEAKEQISNDNSISNPFLKLVLVNYLNGKKAFETVAENPEIVDQIVSRKADAKGGDVAAALKQVKNEANSYPINYFKPGSGKYYVLLEKIGIKNGLPNDWLEKIYSEGRFIDIAKFISSRQGTASAPEYKEPKVGKYDGLMFEKFINSNMDKIIEEVYKRLGK